MCIFESSRVARPNYVLRSAALFFSVVCVLWAASNYERTLNTPPSTFPVNSIVTIEEGSTVKDIAQKLEDAHIVRSAFQFYFIYQTLYKDQYAQAGSYRFNSALTSREIAHALTHGEYRSPLSKITFPEGFRARDFYTFLPTVEKSVTEEELIKNEGYLFPDTYFITSDMTAVEISTLLRDTFTEKILPYAARIESSGFTKEEVIIFASIIEREAKDLESKKIVSGILQNRLQEGMPLQVDAVFDYLLDKESKELTVADLDIDSPFNTYIHTGLPPAPIANPGIDSIEAVLEPTLTDYLYYLTAPDGTFHYARTFEEHKLNKSKYLE